MGGLSTTATVIIIIFAVIILLVFYGIGVYNKLVNSRNKVKDQWAQIDVQLKRRFDLIPNIVETVKGYAKHENDTLKGVVEARNKFNVASTPEDEMKASNELTGAVRQLFALSEAYPELKANQNFIELQKSLEETENKISTSRQFYNDTALTLNNKVEMFPSNIIAKLFGFKKEAFFEAEPEAKNAPKVSF